MSSRQLSDKQTQFAHEYLVDLNATKAAIRAGYAEKSAHVQASRLLSNDKVRALVQKLGKDRIRRTQIDADWVLQRLAEEADADLADIYDRNDNLKPVSEWPEIWRKGLVAGVDVMKLKDRDNEDEPGEVVKVKISDRLKRIELIGRHVAVQAFKDTIEVDVVDRATVLGKARQRAGK